MKLSKRQLGIGLLVVVLLTGGITTVRLADHRITSPTTTVDTAQSPQDVVQQAHVYLDTIDHRTTLTRWTGNKTGSVEKEVTITVRWQHSRSRYRTTSTLYQVDDPETRHVYASDRNHWALIQTENNSMWRETAVPDFHDPRRDDDHVLPTATPAWSQVSANDSVVVYAVSTPDGVENTSRVAAVSSNRTTVLNASYIRLYLDAETGEPQRLVEHYEFQRNFDESEVVVEHRVATFSEYGTVSVTPPDALSSKWSAVGLLRDILMYDSGL